MKGLDDWIAGGHYSSWSTEVRCRKCKEYAVIEGWTEYGTGGFVPEECAECGEPYTELSENIGRGEDEPDVD